MFKFGSVRNPWARVYSLYTRSEAIQCKSVMTFSVFVEKIRFASDTCLHPLRTRNQLDWFIDSDGNILTDYIYRLEDINQAIKDIEDLTSGGIILQKKRLNVNNRPYDYRDIYGEKERIIVGKLFEKDIDYFKYDF